MNRIHKNIHSKTGRVSRRGSSVGPGVLVSRGRIIAIASARAVAPMVAGSPQVSSQAAPPPAKSQTRQLGFVKASVSTMTADKKASRSASSTTAAPDPITTARSRAAAAAAKPAIFTRAQWGANEGLRRAAPSYGKVMVGFVHHTVSSNSYSASQVPAMIRGMYAYHVQGQGWADLGYNFLVDRFGRTWEGRYGGMTKAVVGAQISSYNSVSTGGVTARQPARGGEGAGHVLG